MASTNTARSTKTTTVNEIMDAFKAFDIDNSGFITPDEIQIVMKKLGENIKAGDVEEMMKAADKNNDGKVDYKEFTAIMKLKDEYKSFIID
ncbi:unnamed protein product [Didymodactylos carnosus]|uniref:EF-hand domain-containing protein n=1 Tax=Didymodactylos carnosus TaxID=1234261 RepID=A0A814Z6P6_9BILA|nr:unnamed protein product [Didymodactylos carnosus]CAF1238857.1 unnamed protein product [Didymodactylos carnosus]CAF3790849.1 unnamed protein product [Didymodactylos carnosus]CAF4001038.1 unnamed protein product [Didymodactylos carnosus]